MIGSLARIVESRAPKHSGAVAEAATQIQFRKPGPAFSFGPGQPTATNNVGAQLDAFRGTIYAVVDKIARRIAQMPIHLIQNQIKNDELPEKIELHSHPFLTLFSPFNGRKPHEDFSVWELDYTTQASLDLTGEQFWLIERDDMGKPARVTPLPSNRMQVILSKDTGMIAGHLFTPKGRSEREGIYIPKFTMAELQEQPNWTKPFIVHHRYPSPTGIEDTRGWSPVKAAAYAYDINLFEQIYKSNFLQQGSQLGGILQSDVALSKDQIDEYLDQFASRHSGVRKAGLPMILPKMLKWTTTEPTPRDIQWVEAIGVTESQMLQIYGVSDAKLGRADVGNRATSEAVDVTFNREVIQSRLDVKISKLNSDFLPIYPGQKDHLFFSAHFDDPVPADNAAALIQENQDVTLGIISRNEIRKKRKLQPLGAWGDIAITQANNLLINMDDATLENALQPGAMDMHEAAQQDKQNTHDAEQNALQAKSDAANAKKPEAKPKVSKAVLKKLIGQELAKIGKV